MTKLVTLEEWAQHRYKTPPSSRTLYRWVRDAKIQPLPRKDGKRYFVPETAIYVEPSERQYNDDVRAANEPETN